MAGRIAEMDWSATPLGPSDRWPAALRTAVDLCLGGRFPMFVWWGPQLINLYNDAYAPILRQRHPAALGKPARAVWGDIWPAIAQQVDAVMARGEASWNQRVPLVTQRDGAPEEAFFTWSYSPIRNLDGSIGGLLCVCTEDTQLVLAEQALRQWAKRFEGQSRLFDQIAASTPDFFYVFDLQGRFLYANRRLLEVWGRSFQDAVGKNLYELGYPQWHADMHMREIAQVIETRQPIRGEVPFTGGSGIFGVYEYIFTPVLNERGELECIAGTTRDVTARKQTERELAQAKTAAEASEQRLRAVVEATPECVKIVSPEGDLVYMNPAGLAMIEADGVQSLEGASVRTLIAPQHRDQWMERHNRICAGEKLTWEFEMIGLRGTRRWMETRAVPLPMPDGRNGQLGVTSDITARKQVEAEREQLLESERAARVEAQRASRMKDEFLSTLSHELRTPLNAIVGWSQILRGPAATPEDIAEGIATIERNARAQAQIIEDLLDMSRITSGKLRLDVQPVDLVAIINAGLDTVRPAADAKGVRLAATLDPAAVPVAGDPSRLQQVLWNLLTNAVKFTPRGGRVQVVLHRVHSHVEIRVTDTGEGIPAEFLPHVFDRFRQADASITRRHGGLGLGLSIVKQLVELHGGTVRVESAGPGAGSAFIVMLPLSAVHGPSEAPITHRAQTAAHQPLAARGCISLAGVRVLVVDDEPDARALVERLLHDCRAEVRTADSAADALAQFPAFRPDLLVSDVGMPREDGYSLIRRIRALAPEAGGAVPALALTAYARPEDRIRALAAGFQLHIAKPVEPTELIAAAASLTNRIPAS